jgi:hypothetical protein
MRPALFKAAWLLEHTADLRTGIGVALARSPCSSCLSSFTGSAGQVMADTSAHDLVSPLLGTAGLISIRVFGRGLSRPVRAPTMACRTGKTAGWVPAAGRPPDGAGLTVSSVLVPAQGPKGAQAANVRLLERQ